MFNLIYYFNGGYEEEDKGWFDSVDDAMHVVEKDGWFDSVVDFYEEGYMIKDKNGNEIEC